MTRLLRLLLVLVLAPLALVLVAPTQAVACSCAASTVEDHVERADVVFVGTVERTTRDEGPAGTGLVRHTVTVDETLEGDVAATTTVTTPASGASCGLEGVRDGQQWLFLAAAGAEPDVVDVGLCDGSAPLDQAALERVEALTGAADRPDAVEPGGTVTDDETGPSPHSQGLPVWASASAAGLLLVAVAGGVLWRRRTAG